MKNLDLTEPADYNLFFTVSFSGANYYGFQFQPGTKTIQGLLEIKLGLFFDKKIRIIGAGRLDRGVSAVFYGFNTLVSAKRCDDLSDMTERLRRLLAPKFNLVSIKRVLPGFNSTTSVTDKSYRYLFRNRFHGYFYDSFIPAIPISNLDFERMKQAENIFSGTHDFKAFAGNSNGRRSIRNLKLKLRQLKKGIFAIYIRSDGFLYRQVRMLSAATIDLGAGRVTAETLELLLREPDVPGSGYKPWAAPARGLAYFRARYDQALFC